MEKNLEWFLTYIAPNVVMLIGAYVAIRVDLARLTERINAVKDVAHTGIDSASKAHARIDNILQQHNK